MVEETDCMHYSSGSLRSHAGYSFLAQQRDWAWWYVYEILNKPTRKLTIPIDFTCNDVHF